jgi:hypothetical protein
MSFVAVLGRSGNRRRESPVSVRVYDVVVYNDPVSVL